MKLGLQKFTFLACFFAMLCFSALSQAPAGYYTNADGKTGTELKTVLHNIIKGHTTFPYTAGTTDVWDILKETDRDPANPANVILFYTGWSVNAAQEFNNENGWNREHVRAKSHGPFDDGVRGPGTDCHHLRPTDISVNAARGNYYFDFADVIYIDPSGPTTCKYNASRYVWEPRDAVKGDAARMIFYMAVRYEGDDGFPNLEVVDYIPTNYASPLFGDLSTLLEWNTSDPVDAFEMNRNNVVYGYQKNRNPFIDHPEYANKIWGFATTIDQLQLQPFFYPNPAQNSIFVDLKLNEQVKIYSMEGKLLIQTQNNNIDLSNLDKGIYLIQVIAENNESIKISKLIIE